MDYMWEYDTNIYPRHELGDIIEVNGQAIAAVIEVAFWRDDCYCIRFLKTGYSVWIAGSDYKFA